MTGRMRVELDFESVAKTVIVRCFGTFDLDGARWTAEQITEGIAERPGPVDGTLIDLREAAFSFSEAEIRELVDFVNRVDAEPRGRTAYLVPQDLEFGLMRMYQAYRDRTDPNVRVFRALDEALTWVADREMKDSA